MEQTILLLLRHFSETHATPSLGVAVNRNGICIFLLCETSPKRTLHQVYELLLIEIELIHRNLNIPNKESFSQRNVFKINWSYLYLVATKFISLEKIYSHILMSIKTVPWIINCFTVKYFIWISYLFNYTVYIIIYLI